MNLRGFMTLARRGEQAGVDLYQYETPDGKSLRNAYQWLLPYANGKLWPYEQIEPIHYDDFIPIRLAAQQKFGLPKNAAGTGSQKMNSVLVLTNPVF